MESINSSKKRTRKSKHQKNSGNASKTVV